MNDVEIVWRGGTRQRLRLSDEVVAGQLISSRFIAAQKSGEAVPILGDFHRVVSVEPLAGTLRATVEPVDVARFAFDGGPPGPDVPASYVVPRAVSASPQPLATISQKDAIERDLALAKAAFEAGFRAGEAHASEICSGFPDVEDAWAEFCFRLLTGTDPCPQCHGRGCGACEGIGAKPMLERAKGIEPSTPSLGS